MNCTAITFGCAPPADPEAFKQSTSDKPNIIADTNFLFANASTSDSARLLAVSLPHSSDWLNALPIFSCGLRLDNEDIRVTVDLLLGTALCETHLCLFGALDDINGLHGLSCKLNSGKDARHSNINDLVCRALKRAKIPAIMELTELSRTNCKQPDGLTLISWKADKSALWDVTVVSTMAQSYVNYTS